MLFRSMLSVLSHIEVLGPPGGLPDPAPLLAKVRAHPRIVAAAPYVNGQAMIARDDLVRGVPHPPPRVEELRPHAAAVLGERDDVPLGAGAAPVPAGRPGAFPPPA